MCAQRFITSDLDLDKNEQMLHCVLTIQYPWRWPITTAYITHADSFFSYSIRSQRVTSFSIAYLIPVENENIMYSKDRTELSNRTINQANKALFLLLLLQPMLTDSILKYNPSQPTCVFSCNTHHSNQMRLRLR